MSRLIRTLVLSATALACGSESSPGGGNAPPPEVKLSSIALEVDAAAAPLGHSKVWKAIGTYSDGSTKDLSGQVTWASSDTAVAQMSDLTTTDGLMVTVGKGKTSISASLDTFKVNRLFEVTDPEIDGLRVTPGNLTIGIGKNIQLTAMGTLSDDSTANVTRMVTWTSSNDNVARISATDLGYLVTFGKGAVTITARVGEVSTSADFMITDSSVDFIDLDPMDPRLEAGTSVRITAMGTYTDRTRADVTRQAQWTSSAPAIATVDANGVVNGLAEGMATITAMVDGVTKSTTVRVWVPGQCNYPEPNRAVALNTTIPQLYWLGAYREDGTQVDFRLDQFHCAEAWQRYSTVAFVVGAGWCPNCPEYIKRVNSMQAELEAAGMLIVYVEAETRTRQPANNAQAREIVDREIPGGPGLRVGDGDTQPLARAIVAAIQAFPTALIVRKSDMKVIADQDAYRSRGYLPFVEIARNPERWSQ